MHTETCPYLGLKDDPASFSGYSSKWNACNKTTPPATPKLAFQRSYCLSPSHINCGMYKQEFGQKMPREIQLESRKLSRLTRRNIRLGMIIAVVSVTILVLSLNKNFAHRISTSFFPQPTGDDTAISEVDVRLVYTKTEPAIRESTITPTATLTASATSMSTQTPVTPTLTAELPLRLLDIPIGDEYQFVIHRVLEGESLQNYAATFNTSVEAIMESNYNLISPLWIDWIVVIPVNNTDVSGLPLFEGYQITDDKIRAVLLAEKLSVPVDDLIHYNDFEADQILLKGEWVLVPRQKP